MKHLITYFALCLALLGTFAWVINTYGSFCATRRNSSAVVRVFNTGTFENDIIIKSNDKDVHISYPAALHSPKWMKDRCGHACQVDIDVSEPNECHEIVLLPNANGVLKFSFAVPKDRCPNAWVCFSEMTVNNKEVRKDFNVDSDNPAYHTIKAKGGDEYILNFKCSRPFFPGGIFRCWWAVLLTVVGYVLFVVSLLRCDSTNNACKKLLRQERKKGNIIGSLTGLKVLALLCIYWMHSGIPIPKDNGIGLDLGTQACMFFFMCSGLLIGCHYWEKWFCPMPAWGYVAKKVRSVWMVHFVAFLLCLHLIPSGKLFTIKTLIASIINLSFIHGWLSDEMTRSFNGASWFLSALLFCYLISPLVIYVLRKLGWKGLVLFVLARILIEWISFEYPGYFWKINVHRHPIVRALEFSVGVGIWPIVMQIKQNLSTKWCRGRILFTMLEILAIVGLVTIVLPCHHSKNYGFVIIGYLLFLTIFSIDNGWIARFLSTRIFVFCSLFELEFFLLHQPIMFIFRNDLLKGNTFLVAHIILFVIISVLVILWHIAEAAFRMQGVPNPDSVRS